jgi:hypothetical protein
MNTTHVLRVNQLRRRAAALGTTVAHVIRLDADLERQALASAPPRTKENQHAAD